MSKFLHETRRMIENLTKKVEDLKRVNMQVSEQNIKLKQQLAESEERAERYKNWYNESAGESAELKQQLAEQKRVCDWLDNVLKEYSKQEELLSKKLKSLGVDCIEDLGKEYNQDKISFTVEQLEKVKELLFGKAIEITGTSVDTVRLYSINEIFDNQIKQLKEGK